MTVLVRGAGLKLTMSQYLIDQIKARTNITVEPYTRVVSVGGEHSLETICTVTGEEAPRTRHAEGLFVMIGANAQTDWLPAELKRDEQGYVCTGRISRDGRMTSGLRICWRRTCQGCSAWAT